MIDVEGMAGRLDEAARYGRAVNQFGDHPGFGIDEAYAVQRASLSLRKARGERTAGLKMGFTSRAKMVQMGLSDLICGELTDAMLVEEGGAIEIDRYVHPRAEPEIAFLLRKPLVGHVSAFAALDAVEAVAPAIEIIDSRYENFKFSLTDVVADNSSSSGFVIGPWHGRDADIANLGIILSVSGRPVSYGSTASILGHPLRSLIAAARMSVERGIPLEAGSIVLAGGATAATALNRGDDVLVEMEALGRAGFSLR
jgi:2-oxo-3-hexenedioate decarboxylase